MNRTRILVISTISPAPVNRGDRLRLNQHLKYLAEIADVRLVYFDRAWDPADDTGLDPRIDVRRITVRKPDVIRQALVEMARRRPTIVYRFYNASVIRELTRQRDEFRPDLVWMFQTDAFPAVEGLGDCARVLDVVDSLSLHFKVVGRQPNLPWRTRLARATQPGLEDLERTICRECDCVLVSSGENERHLAQVAGSPDRIRLLYNSVAQDYLDGRWKRAPFRGKMLFVGYIGYPPNEMAVRAFAKDALPAIRQQVPNAEFVVCGGGEQCLQDLRDTPGLTLLGFVDDLVAAYEDADVFVNPTPYATGVQNKLIEAMAVGLPAITSRASLGANGVTENENVLVADTPEEWSRAIQTLQQDPAEAERLSESGRQFMDEHFTPETQRAQIHEIVARALTAPTTQAPTTPASGYPLPKGREEKGHPGPPAGREEKSDSVGWHDDTESLVAHKVSHDQQLAASHAARGDVS